MIIRQVKARSVRTNLKSVVRLCEAVYISSLYFSAAPRRTNINQIMLATVTLLCALLSLCDEGLLGIELDNKRDSAVLLFARMCCTLVHLTNLFPILTLPSTKYHDMMNDFSISFSAAKP